MRWYKHLYIGEHARKKKRRIIHAVRMHKFQSGIYVLTQSVDGQNLMDIYPAMTLLQEHYRKQDLMVLGIAVGYFEALEVARQIVDDMYQKTGDFSLPEFLGGENR